MCGCVSIHVMCVVCCGLRDVCCCVVAIIMYSMCVGVPLLVVVIVLCCAGCVGVLRMWMCWWLVCGAVAASMVWRL